ncbi:MAG: hypothetical protein ACK40G_09705 [Cytophagaceae bacterium]
MLNILILLCSSFCFFVLSSRAEEIVVADALIKIKGKAAAEVYIGLQEGDQLVMDIEETGRRKVVAAEVWQYPDNLRYRQEDLSLVDDKIIPVTHTGVFLIKFKNSSLFNCSVRYKLVRIPKSASASRFNTNVYWKTAFDTVYSFSKKRGVFYDTSIVSVIPHQVQRVYARTAFNGKSNKSYISFDLPANTISWSYYIGVGENSEVIFRQAEEKARRRREDLKNIAAGMSRIFYADPSASLALGILALYGIAEFGVPDRADNVQYYFVKDEQAALSFVNKSNFFSYEKGDGPLSGKRIEGKTSGKQFLCLQNDNYLEAIDVHLRIAAVTVTETKGERLVKSYTLKEKKVPYIAQD